MGGGASKPQLYGVNLHLYDLVRRDSLGGLFGDLTGMHALHSGVEIFKAKLDKNGKLVAKKSGTEYSFGSADGVWKQKPKVPPKFDTNRQGENLGLQCTYKESLFIGGFEMNPKELNRVLEEAKSTWKGSGYHPLQRNCNHFSDYLTFKLCGKHIPSHVNALANTTNAAVGLIGGLLSGMANALEAAANEAHEARREYDSIPVAQEVNDSRFTQRGDGPEIRVLP